MIDNISQKEYDEVRVSQRAEGKCPYCKQDVSIAIPPDMIDWKIHYEDLEKEFKKLQKEYYKEKGYYDKNKEIQRHLANLRYIKDIDIDKLVEVFKEIKNIS